MGTSDPPAGPNDEKRPEPTGIQDESLEELEIFPAYDEREESPALKPIQPFLGRSDSVPDEHKQTVRFEIPTSTIIKVILTLVVIWLVLKVASVFLLLLLAVIVCLAMLPLVRRIERRGLPRGAAVAVVFAGFLAIVAGFGLLIVPPLVTQTDRLIDNAPEYLDNFDQVLDRYPGVRDRVDEYLGTGDSDNGDSTSSSDDGESGGPSVDPAAVQEGATAVISVGARIVGGIANAFFVIILALYLLVEGERTWNYFARYMTPTLRYRFHRLGPQLTQVVSGYVLGQSIISSAFAIYSYIVLLVLDVPQPLLLALFGAIAVAIPIVGVPIATVAAMAIALAVDWQTSLIVLAAFTAYQMFENYILVPRVYGNTLQVTSLSILVGVLVGGQLMGILGIVLSLPITAAIPVIERVWREEIPGSVEVQEAGIADAGKGNG